MDTIKRVGAFIVGSSLGAGIGAAVATLAAPESGDDLRQRVKRVADDVQHAGDRARQEKEGELADRFRSTVKDPAALPDEPSPLTNAGARNAP